MQLKKIPTIILIVIEFTLIILLSGEVDNTLAFIISKLILTSLFLFNSYILLKFGNKNYID